MLFGIAGRKGHGKDTCADIMVATDPDNVVKVAFADPLKGACAALFGFSNTQLHDATAKETVDPRWGITPRRAMQFLGTDLVQQHMHTLLPGIGQKFFVEAMRHRVEALFQQGNNGSEGGAEPVVIISDVRFQHEVDLVHELGGIVLRVVRPCTSPCAVPDAHPSETCVDSLQGIDEEVINDGTLADLEGAIKAAGERILARLQAESEQEQCDAPCTNE